MKPMAVVCKRMKDVEHYAQEILEQHEHVLVVACDDQGTPVPTEQLQVNVEDVNVADPDEPAVEP